MSTNYHWVIEPIVILTGATVTLEPEDPRVHIGLASGGEFVWAQDPTNVEQVALTWPEARLIEDEYGRRFSWAEFKAVIAGLPERRDLIGQRFG